MKNFNVYLEVEDEHRFIPSFQSTGRAVLRVGGMKSKAEALKWAIGVYPEAHYVDVHEVDALGIDDERSMSGWLNNG